jgi:hypothetical protein
VIILSGRIIGLSALTRSFSNAVSRIGQVEKPLDQAATVVLEETRGRAPSASGFLRSTGAKRPGLVTYSAPYAIPQEQGSGRYGPSGRPRRQGGSNLPTRSVLGGIEAAGPEIDRIFGRHVDIAIGGGQ